MDISLERKGDMNKRFSDLIQTRRSIRQYERRPIERQTLDLLANAARLAPSAANLQPLEFMVVDDEALCRSVLAHLKWAAYITPNGNPRPGNEPAAYIVVLLNTDIRDKMYEYDVGAAQMSMILTAWSEGIGSCWIISVDKASLTHLLGLPQNIKVDSVLALGYPAEQSVIEEYKDSVKYWKDESGLFHVPKRKPDKVIHHNKY
jgi:nitroreductase